MCAKRKKAGSLFTPRWEHSSDVQYVRKVISDEVEHIALEKGRLVLPLRGGLSLLSWLDQAYDMPNVIGLEILLGETEMIGIRKVDKELEQKVLRLLRGGSKGSEVLTTFEQRLRILVIFG